jgi:hypothetical protein
MLTRDVDAFLTLAASLSPDAGPGCAKSVFLISPDGFRLSEQSASDNRYMRLEQPADALVAMSEHHALQLEISKVRPVICFPGAQSTPDAVFPNNVFATTPGRLIIGHMRHPVRQSEVLRPDIRGFFTDTLGYREVDLSAQAGICELTGSLIIDRARNIGFCGLSERCDEAGARAMYEAFNLDACLLFNLAEGEYHTNVVLSVLASRAVVVAASGFRDAAVAEAIAGFYGGRAIRLRESQKDDYAGNCIALTDHTVFLSQRALDSLDPEQCAQFADYGFSLVPVALPMLERAGGSLRCCVGEIF